LQEEEPHLARYGVVGPKRPHIDGVVVDPATATLPVLGSGQATCNARRGRPPPQWRREGGHAVGTVARRGKRGGSQCGAWSGPETKQAWSGRSWRREPHLPWPKSCHDRIYLGAVTLYCSPACGRSRRSGRVPGIGGGAGAGGVHGRR
jgi:hypothetical protein